ncbi:DUF695 domain-containing protein [Paenibacillus flagellatus]|nr:DUF695 domain-containing protein [Paenibacillus flagellatus]
MGKQWDYFHRTTEQREHMSVLVDATYAADAPRSGLTRLLSVVVNLYAIATDKEERDGAQAKLGAIERRLERTFAERLQAVYVGRINTESRLEFYYYAKPDGPSHQKLAGQIMTAYPKYRWIAAERDDADWSFYDYLRPSDVEKLYAKNNVLLQSLSDKGDRLDMARDVYHWLRFGSKDEMRKASDNAKRLGYIVVNAEYDTEMPALPHTLVLSKHQPIAIGDMNDAVAELHELASSLAGRYEGWGTDVRRKLWGRWKERLSGRRVAYAGLAVLAVLLVVVPILLVK